MKQAKIFYFENTCKNFYYIQIICILPKSIYILCNQEKNKWKSSHLNALTSKSHKYLKVNQ